MSNPQPAVLKREAKNEASYVCILSNDQQGAISLVANNATSRLLYYPNKYCKLVHGLNRYFHTAGGLFSKLLSHLM